MLTAAEFKTRFPELDAETDALVDMCLAEAETEISRTAWSSLADSGVLHLAGHKIAVLAGSRSGKKPAPGPVQAKSVGGVSISYGAQFGALGAADNSLTSTHYGREYLRLRSLVFGKRFEGSP